MVIDLTVHGLTGGEGRKVTYMRECMPAFDLASYVLSHIETLVNTYKWISSHHVQRVLHALIVALERSWSSFAIKYGLFRLTATIYLS